MPLIQLIYVSEVAVPMTPADISRLAHLSQRNNRQRDITGALGWTGRYFIQFIEGRQEDIDTLMDRIGRDGRHRAVVQLCRAESDTRRFGRWSLRCFDSHALDDEAHEVHRAGTADKARAQALIAKMEATLQPGGTLDGLPW